MGWGGRWSQNGGREWGGGPGLGGGEVTKWGQWGMSMGPNGALWGLAKPNEASAGPNGARGIQKGLMGVPGVIRGSPGDSGGSLGFPGGHVGEIRAPPHPRPPPRAEGAPRSSAPAGSRGHGAPRKRKWKTGGGTEAGSEPRSLARAVSREAGHLRRRGLAEKGAWSLQRWWAGSSRWGRGYGRGFLRFPPPPGGGTAQCIT